MTDPKAHARERALTHIRALLGQLREAPDSSPLREAVAMTEHLLAAVEAFHLEAIRFRIFGLSRFVHGLGDEAAREVIEQVAGIRKDLEAAGFHTKSL